MATSILDTQVFFEYGDFLDIFGYYCCFACTRRAQFPKKFQKTIFWIFVDTMAFHLHQTRTISQKNPKKHCYVY